MNNQLENIRENISCNLCENININVIYMDQIHPLNTLNNNVEIINEIIKNNVYNIVNKYKFL